VRDLDPRLARLMQAKPYPGLRLLVLFGSRARGDAAANADWDFAYLAAAPFDADALLADLAGVIGADRIDLVDLARAGGQLRYRAARDGRIVYEGRPGAFERFWLDAVSFWCDVAPVVGRAYEGVLSRLER
jgi:predicted nucleotidyltransferase